MNIVFLVDNYSTWNRQKDTSFSLMLGAQNKGHKVFLLFNGGLFFKDSQAFFQVVQAQATRQGDEPFINKKPCTLSQDEVDAVFVRTDPPFDEQYLQNTWALDLLDKRIVVINKPGAIRSTNEKLWALRFKDLVPPSFVGRNKEELLKYVNQYKHVIAKPLNGFGGQGIFNIQADDLNKNVILETLTEHFSKEILLQKYIPEAKNGDKRILLLNGEPLGAILRVHSDKDHRNNLFAGGKSVKTQITDRDMRIVEVLKPHLIEKGLYFVGIDIIGDYLIEVNVTSPTCLQEIAQAQNQPLEEKVISFIENLVDQSKSQDRIVA